MPQFIGIGTTFSHLLRWPVGIERIRKCKSRFCKGGFPSYIFLSVYSGWNSRKHARSTRGRCMEMVSSLIPPDDATAHPWVSKVILYRGAL